MNSDTTAYLLGALTAVPLGIIIGTAVQSRLTREWQDAATKWETAARLWQQVAEHREANR